MNSLETLLDRAWQVRQAHFFPILGVDYPQYTRSLSLTGAACSLDCAHCGGHYLKAMLPITDLSPDDPRLNQVRSLLISGGCDPWGRVPIDDQVERVRALRQGRRLNWHVGLIDAAGLQAIEDLVDVVSFDLVGDNATIAEVYGLEATVDDYRATYRMLRQRVSVVPHVTIGLRGGRISGERAVLQLLQEEGAEAIVFLVMIPTPGTRYADHDPPPVEAVARLLAEARLAFPDTPLLLGCMRPAGLYRRSLDLLAVRAGINRIVKPDPTAVDLAHELDLQIERHEECCTLALPRPYPRQLRVSAGTETVLGLRHRPMEAAPTTAYLMLDGGGCAMGCAFCAQARDSHARSDALSRIIWPEYPSADVLTRLQDPKTLERVCIQVTLHRGALDELASLARALCQHTALPISAAIRPPNLASIETLFAGGIDVIGLGLDAACERVYREVKRDNWTHLITLVQQACARYPGRIRVHLIVGLGESEQEFCHTMQQIYDWGGAVGLFAFTPVRGTPLEHRPQPPLGSYRRLQAARYLLQQQLARVEQFRFDGVGRLTDLGRPDLRTLLADGEAFRTSGCPGCNRPFYNERPGGTIYNYPQALRPEQAEQAMREMNLPSDSPPGTKESPRWTNKPCKTL